MKITDIKPNPDNPRLIKDDKFKKLCKSISEFPQMMALRPIIVDADGVILGGNMRYQALKHNGVKDLPDEWVKRADDLTEEEKKRFVITDNSSFGEYDWEMIANEWGDLPLGDWGLDVPDFTGLEVKDAEEDDYEIPDEIQTDIVQGDLIEIGEHRLMCGDSTKAEHVERLMAGAKADICFTSPPYGQQRDYTEEGKAKVADWDGLMCGVFGNLPMADDGQVLVNLGMIHRDGEWIPYWDSWIEWMREQGWQRFGWYVWDQGSGLPGDWNGRLAPSHEFVFHFTRAAVKPEKFVQKKANSGPMGSNLRSKEGRNAAPSSVCIDPNKIPDSVIRVNRNSAHKTGHPATFPVPLPAFAMQAWPGVAYEPFCGSGTTLIAAEQLGRKCYGMELAPKYCQIIVDRMRKLDPSLEIKRNGEVWQANG